MLFTAFHTDDSPAGYSYKTNQHGLAINNILSFNLDLPNSTIAYVTRSTYPDLFFGSKGGFNNFVRCFSSLFAMQTFHFVTACQLDVDSFSGRTDCLSFSRVQTGPCHHCRFLGQCQGISYDGPTPPSCTFDNFTNILPIQSDSRTCSYSDMILSADTNSTTGSR